ncbi:putative exporter of polyketide antibiotics [Mycobacterium sp. JS623]|uniref:ABC transporter permease n=1 Tax=Mycobacterium sp. JS623 TaxID=212767 RepID=UPI0002A5B82B|nr:exporter of polyketide antibiotics [Mycobacterium sp. JS623]AGB25083.1 putative exporter of polyketide antibiotics [Mycobacterium sp. JS623]
MTTGAARPTTSGNTLVTPHGGRHEAAPSGSPFTGVPSLLWLALRRDRIRLSVWVTMLTLMMVYAPNAVKLAYPEEPQRLARVNLLKTPAGMMLGGPMFGGNETDLGVMMANELMLTLIIAASILAITTVIRHTRAEEENGIAELVSSSVVGRYARTYAALILVGGVNAVLAVTMTLAMASTGFAFVDTAAMSLGITGVAMVFGAVAAVTAQLWRQARTATGAAMAALALAALVRGIGDVIDNSGSALSWFSPIAWAQQMRAFVDLRWWPFAMLVGLTIALMALAAWLESSRQYDAGVIPSTGEKPNARPISGVFVLHLTLQRGQTIGWTIGLFLGGLAFGSMTKSLLDAAKENPLLARVLTAQGTDGVYTTMTQFLAAAATAYVVSAVLRVYNDEQSGLGEAVLAGAVSRWRWLLSAVAAALAGSVVLMFFAGLGNGLGAGLTLGEPATIARLTLAGLAYVPAMAVIAGIAALAVAVRHTWIGWLAVTFVVMSLYLGALLRLPRWLIDLSPVGRTTAPTDYPVVALTVMVVAAAALTFLAGWLYRIRDAI